MSPSVRATLLLPLVCLACGDTPAGTPSTAPAPPPTAPVAAAPGRNLAMGTGQSRDPQPFTVEQRLLDAVRRGDRPTAERALALGAPVTAKDDLGRSTVLLAAKDAGDVDLVAWLHAKGAPIDDPDAAGRTPLSFAAAEGRLDVVRWLVEHGAVVDRRDGHERTACFHAALGDHADVVAYLLDRGAQVNARDRFGDTPLIAACAKGHAATAQRLLDRGADPTLTDQEGRTARERSAPGVEPCLRSRPD